MARFSFGLLALALALAPSGCGLTLDYSPPEDSGMDAGARDAAGGDAGSDDAGRDDAPLPDGAPPEDDASPDDGAIDAELRPDANAPCTSSADCGDGTCVHPCDGSTAAYCAPADEICPSVEVCGCDGEVYTSLCAAHRAGVEAAVDPAMTCPGVCFPATCPMGDCVSCPGGTPACRMLAPLCFEDPVCGCDGSNYLGNCDAYSHGVAEFRTGFCLPDDCATSLDCERGSYCERRECGTTFGRCAPLPAVEDPFVCGCSGRRYLGSHGALLREGQLGPCDVCPILATTCCADSADCGGRQACVNPDPALGPCSDSGSCVDLTAVVEPPACWTAADCGPGLICLDAQVCRCGKTCLRPDAPGTCVPP
jgi:hypothetical protein